MTAVTAISQKGQPYRLAVKARAHSVVSDVPKAVGGLDTGMTPHEMFLGGIAGCIADTLWMHANMKKWDLQEISVTVTESLVNDPSQTGKKIPQLVEQIEVKGNLTADQVARLHALAPKCPVHKLFTGPKLTTSSITHVAPPATP